MVDREFRDFERNLKRTPKKSSSSENEPDIKPDIRQDDQFSHPVYNAISYLNGQINRMDLFQMRHRCRELGLETSGKREALKRRLKEYYKTKKLIEAGLISSDNVKNVDYLIVIDFEATCEERNPPGYPHEIIEFPAVLVASRDEPRIVDVFHQFVRPVINPVLSDFCFNLTGIGQDVVNSSQPFPVVHSNFLAWIRSHQLGVTKSFSIVTDGPFDMGRFLFLQTLHLNMPYPSYASHWTNLRKCFASFYKGDFYASQNTPQRLPGLQNMLTSLGMEFEGQPHSGLDDAKNIARVLIRLILDGALIRVNEKIAEDSFDDANRGGSKLVSVTPVSRREAEELFQRQVKKAAKATKKETLKLNAQHNDSESGYEPKQLFESKPSSIPDEDSLIVKMSPSTMKGDLDQDSEALKSILGITESLKLY